MYIHRSRSALVLAVALVLTATVSAQTTVTPTNSAPNPYQTVENWAKLPRGEPGDPPAQSKLTATGSPSGSQNGVVRTRVSTQRRTRYSSSTKPENSLRALAAG